MGDIMPELPEVETVKETLKRKILKRLFHIYTNTPTEKPPRL